MSINVVNIKYNKERDTKIYEARELFNKLTIIDNMWEEVGQLFSNSNMSFSQEFNKENNAPEMFFLNDSYGNILNALTLKREEIKEEIRNIFLDLGNET